MDTGSLTIRAAGKSDLPQLLDLYRELQPGDPVLTLGSASPHMDQILAHPGMKLLIATVDQLAVATITLIVIPNLTRGGAPYGLMENVVTAKAHRKRGYAGALIQHGFEIAWKADCYKVMLLSGSTDPETLDFYRNCGFVQNKTGFQIRRPSGV